MAEEQAQHYTGLKRTMGLFSAFTLVVSSMIGSGVFKKVAPMMEALGSPWWVIMAWVGAGLVSLIGALTNAEVAGLIADPGGQYAYFKRMYGKAFSFSFGWTSFAVIQTATAASVAYVFAQSVNSLVALPHLPAYLEEYAFFDNMGVKLVAIGLITLLTIVNYRGVENGGFVSNLIASTMVIAIFAIVIIGLGMDGGTMDHFTNATSPVDTLGTSAIFTVFFAAMMQAFWAYEGWNNLGFMGGEIKNPTRNIPLALILGVGVVMVVYTIINFTYLYVLSPDELIAIAKNGNAIAGIEVIRKLLGATGVLVVSILICVATFGSTNGVLLTASRLYFTMANDRLFFKQANKVHPKYKTPSVSLIIQGVWSSLLVLSGSFDQLTDMLVFAAFLYYGAMAAGVFVLRFKEPNTPRPIKAFGYPILPALFILFCIVLVVSSIIERPRDCMYGLLLIGSGLPFYLVWRKNSEADKLEA
jgi:APA family basic amino acid/polyamine antiporter